MEPAFISLSAALTGFSETELQGTGIAEDLWNELVAKAGWDIAGGMLEVWTETGDIEAILSDDTLGTPCRILLAAWYTGQWGATLFDAQTTISNQAYIQALVWKAAKAHPMGAKQPGFGTWAYPTDYLRKTDK